MSVHRPGFLKERLKEVLPSRFITGKRRLELETKVLTEHAQTNQDEVEVTKLIVLLLTLFHSKCLTLTILQ